MNPRDRTKPSGGRRALHSKLPQLEQRSDNTARIVPMPHYRLEGCGRRRSTKKTRFESACESIAEM